MDIIGDLIELFGDWFEDLPIEDLDAEQLTDLFEGLDYTELDLGGLIDLGEWDIEAWAAEDMADGGPWSESAGYYPDLGADGNIGLAALTDSPFDDSIASELSSYPSSLLGDRPITVNYTDALHPEGDLGRYHPGTGNIELYDNADSVTETFHHEVGHHILPHNREMMGDLWNAVRSSPLCEDLSDWLSLYSRAERKEEACVQAIAKFKCNPVNFAIMYPGVHEVLTRWLGRSA